MTWQESAACRDLPTALFYPEAGEAPSELALAACRSCPVAAACAAHASANAEHGIWGGLSENARNELRRARRLPKPPALQREHLRELDLELAPLPKEPRHREYRRRRRLTRLGESPR